MKISEHPNDNIHVLFISQPSIADGLGDERAGVAGIGLELIQVKLLQQRQELEALEHALVGDRQLLDGSTDEH